MELMAILNVIIKLIVAIIGLTILRVIARKFNVGIGVDIKKLMSRGSEEWNMTEYMQFGYACLTLICLTWIVAAAIA